MGSLDYGCVRFEVGEIVFREIDSFKIALNREIDGVLRSNLIFDDWPNSVNRHMSKIEQNYFRRTY